MSVDWDARYARKAYVYGEKACIFLEEALARGWLPAAPARVLLLGEGEGRNAVFLAARGYDCVALDPSTVGLEKCARLAARRGVRVEGVAGVAEDALRRGALGLFDA